MKSNKTTACRTHDKDLYLNESRYSEPKERDVFVLDLIEELGLINDKTSICDFGCAAGEFLHSASKRFPQASMFGYDIVPELVGKAKRMVPDAKIEVGSVEERSLCEEQKFDVSVMMGVLSIFDDYEAVLDNMLFWTNPKGRCIILGAFNPYPADVWVSYRSKKHPKEHRESGWNIFSQETIGEFLGEHQSVEKYIFHPFRHSIDIEKSNEVDRSWTFKNELGERLLTNGLSLLLELSALEIIRSEE